MYQRRVQITGGGTYLVTLPKEWADEVGVTQGSSMTLIPNDSGALLLIPQPVRERNRCSIPMDERDSVHLQRDIIARYIAGYDVIEVVGKRIRPEQRRIVREIAQALVGVEILEETQSTVVLHSVVNIRDFPAQQSIHRIFDITLAMLGDAVAAFIGQDEELAQDVVERDGDVDRLELLVARQLGLLLRDLLLEEEVGLSRFEFLYHHKVADQLERVADHAVKISRATFSLASPVKETLVGQIQDRARAAEAILSEAVAAFVGRDSQRANRVLAEKAQTERLLAAARAFANEQPENAHPISITFDSLLRTREYGFNIAEIAIDAAVPLGRRPKV